jgi:hypothetical protein
MKRIRGESLSSKGSVKSRPGVARELRGGLELMPADSLSPGKAADVHSGPFAVFSEWASEIDERAYYGF